MNMIRKLIKALLFLLGGVILLSVIAYWAVPPLTRALYDVPAIEAKLKTRLLPSDQPATLPLSREEKRIFRAAHLDTYLGVAGATLLELPAYLYHLMEGAFASPRRIRAEDFGLFVDGARASERAILDRLKSLGVRSAGIRIYLTREYLDSEAYRRNLSLAEKLHEEGIDLMVVLAQLKESFDENLTEIAATSVRDFAPYAASYQIGETLNRSKWGLWSPERYRRLLRATFGAIAKYDPDARTVGPSVIDFEWYYTLYYWSLAGGRFDILNTLLYVDRVREPEKRQLGFDTLAKIRMMKAVAPDKPLWITEVNWPISGTGRYKPTSEREAVRPEKYRDYMLRYLIIALSSGEVERVYWWQLHARGYGLVDHLEDQSPYPAYAYFGALLKLLDGAKPVRNDHEGARYRYLFEKRDRLFGLFWTRDGASAPVPPEWECRDLVSGIGRSEYGPTPLLCKERE